MKRLFLILIVLGLAGGAGVLGYRTFELGREKRGLEEALAQSERRAAQMKQRAEEEKARGAAAQRARAAAETQKAETQTKFQAALAEAEALKAEREKLSCQLEELRKGQTAIQEQSAQRIAALESEKADLATRLHKAGEALKSKEADLERAGREADALKADLERAARENAKMREHNRKLVAIAEDLIEKYRRKGTAKDLLENEPFTQIGKIEYEKLRQDYLDRIHKEKLR